MMAWYILFAAVCLFAGLSIYFDHEIGKLGGRLKAIENPPNPGPNPDIMYLKDRINKLEIYAMDEITKLRKSNSELADKLGWAEMKLQNLPKATAAAPAVHVHCPPTLRVKKANPKLVRKIKSQMKALSK